MEQIHSPREIFLVIAEHRFSFRLTFDALQTLEGVIGGGLFAFATALARGSWPAVKLSEAALVLFAGCQHQGTKAPTLEECFNAIIQEGADVAIPKLLEPLSVYISGSGNDDDQQEEKTEGKPEA